METSFTQLLALLGAAVVVWFIAFVIVMLMVHFITEIQTCLILLVGYALLIIITY